MFRKGNIPWNKGYKGCYKLSEETKKKISIGMKKYWENNPKMKERYSILFKIKNPLYNDITRKKLSKTLKKIYKEGKLKGLLIRGYWKGKKLSKEHKEKITKNTLKALLKRPTSFEQKIINLCNESNLPFKYVGNGQLIIDGKNPDFIECNGKKLIIEVYEKFFKNRNYGSYKNYEKERYKIFAKYGFKTLFLNEDDLCIKNWKKKCLNKIKNFIGGD